MEKSQNTNFFDLGQELVRQLTWRLNEAIFSKIWLESKQMKINNIFIFLNLKPIPLL